MMRRLATTVLVGAGLILLSVASVSAATPAFEFETDVTGSSIQMTVTFEPVPQGFNWASLEASGLLNELVGIFPADTVGDSGRPHTGTEPVLLSLERRDEGTYQVTTEVSSGRWAVVAWPLHPDLDLDANPGAARTVFVTVGGPPAWMWLSVVLMAAIVLVTAVGRRRSERNLVDSNPR